MNYFLSEQDERKLIRFIDSRYNTLFYVEDGKNLILEFNDSQTIIGPCTYIDPYHFSFQNRTWHICEFAEFNERNQNYCRPEQEVAVISNEIMALAHDALRLAKEIDPYEYMDSYETEEALLNEIVQSIANGEVADMIDWYRPIVEEEFEQAKEAENIIDRLEKYQKNASEKISIYDLIHQADDKKTVPKEKPKEHNNPER